MPVQSAKVVFAGGLAALAADALCVATFLWFVLSRGAALGKLVLGFGFCDNWGLLVGWNRSAATQGCQPAENTLAPS